MPLVPGYNFVRAGGLVEFQTAFQHQYEEPTPTKVSVVQFLRLVQHRREPPHRCLLVTGFDRLWAVCEDDGALYMKIKQLLTTRANWIANHLDYVYFQIPHEVTFLEAQTMQLCLPSGSAVEYVDLDAIFGSPDHVETDHYHRPFALS